MLHWQVFKEANWVLWLLSIFGHSFLHQQRLGMLRKFTDCSFGPTGRTMFRQVGGAAWLFWWCEVRKHTDQELVEFPCPVVYMNSRNQTFQMLNLSPCCAVLPVFEDVVNPFDPAKWLSIFHTCGLFLRSSFFDWKTTSWHFFVGDSRSVWCHNTHFLTNITALIFVAVFIYLLENPNSVLHLKQDTSSGFSFWFFFFF